jgi:hypothetical protein
MCPYYHLIGGWVSARAGKDTVEKREIIPESAGNRTLVIQSIARRYIKWNIPAPNSDTVQNIFINLSSIYRTVSIPGDAVPNETVIGD